MAKISQQDALDYHSNGRPGKIEVIPTKPTSSQRDLSLAYSPGVADPCLAIAANKSDAYKYTAKGNLVAVISNGTAVLGLGDIGPAAGKPVMEGKGLLFKIYADIDVFDIELDTCGLNCPLPILKAKKALSSMTSGQLLRVVATDSGSVRDFQAFARQTGNELLDQQTAGADFIHVMKRR